MLLNYRHCVEPSNKLVQSTDQVAHIALGILPAALFIAALH
jgi:hypothetical protein